MTVTTHRRLHSIAVGALLCLSFASPSWAERTGAGAALTRGHDKVEASVDRLREVWRGANVKSVNAMGGKSAKVLEVHTEERHLFIVRRPRRGFEHGLRVNLAQQRLAAAMGEEHMVPEAVIDTTRTALDQATPAGSQVMIVRHVGRAYTNANKLSSAQLATIPERTRLVAAIVDLLSEQLDRKSENILVKDDGVTIRLIDPDKSFGERTNCKYRSQFFHGGMVGYTSAQQHFADLPPDLQTFVDELSKAPLDQVQKIYGLHPEEAQVVSTRAAQIRQVGLRQAIDAYVTSLGALHAPE